MPRRRSAKRSTRRRSAKRSTRRRTSKRRSARRSWWRPWAFGEFPGDRPRRSLKMDWDAPSPEAAEIDARNLAYLASLNAKRPPLGVNPWIGKDGMVKPSIYQTEARRRREEGKKPRWWKKIM